MVRQHREASESWSWGPAWWSSGQDSVLPMEGLGSIPGRGSKIPHARVAQPIKERKKQGKWYLIHIYETKMIKMN